MSWDDIEANWLQVKGAVRERWGKLTDDDLAEIGGARDQMVGKLMEIYDLSEEQADRELTAWLTVFRPTTQGSMAHSREGDQG